MVILSFARIVIIIGVVVDVFLSFSSPLFYLHDLELYNDLA
jgi:hypothetical protein